MLMFLSGCPRGLVLVEAVTVVFHDDFHGGRSANVQDILRGRRPSQSADWTEMHQLMDFDTFVHGVLWWTDLARLES
jgi:hypothetical protein